MTAKTRNDHPNHQGTMMNDRELLQPAPAVPDGLRGAVNALLHQIDIGDFVDSNGHSAKMLKPVHDLMRLMSESAAPAVPAYTEGHCEEKAKKGGCQLHNLHCGYPACDRRPAAPAVREPVAWKHDCAALCTNDVELWIDACPHCGKPRTTTPTTKD